MAFDRTEQSLELNWTCLAAHSKGTVSLSVESHYFELHMRLLKGGLR